MFALPSLWNLLVSTLVFFIAAWYIKRYLEQQGIPKGMTRGLLVFMLAYGVSWGSGEALDWLTGNQPTAQTSGDLSQLLQAAEKMQQ